MTNRIMLRANANENTVSIRTVSARMKSPQHFYICYDKFDHLRKEGRIISSDIRSFVKIRLDEKHDRIAFDFTWLTGYGFERVEGTEQSVDLRWSRFREFLDACRQPDGPKEFKAVSLGPRRDRPRLVFAGNRENLKAAVADRRVRHKLGKALMANFNWPDADEIRLGNDSVPYSFFFREFRDERPVMCGGLILHGQEDMSKAHYQIHT